MAAAGVAVRALTLVGIVACSDAAWAGVCEEPAADPVPVGLRAGGIDVTRGACLRTDLDARVGAHALVDTADFYGTLGAGLQLSIRFIEQIGLEWGASLDLVDFTFAQTAVVTATETTYGPVTAHVATSRAVDRDLEVGVAARVQLPFTRSSLDSSIAGGQLAALASMVFHPRLTVHGRGGLIGWYGASSGGNDVRGAVIVSADASVRAWKTLHAIVGAEIQAGWYGGGVDHTAARLGAHARVRGAWHLDGGVMLPLAGEERTDLVVTIGVLRDFATK
jgi:hypothetical protein